MMTITTPRLLTGLVALAVAMVIFLVFTHHVFCLVFFECFLCWYFVFTGAFC